MKPLLKILLIFIFFPGLVFAGGIGSGGSPPAILLPNSQFTQMSLGILRGEDILIRSEGVERIFATTGFDTTAGTITVAAPDDGETFVLQDFEKKFGKVPVPQNLLQEMKPSSKKEKPITLTIPVNPDVSTVPKINSADEFISE